MESDEAAKAEDLFWDLAGELQAGDERIAEGKIMSSRCLRVGKEFLAMNHHKAAGLVVKLPAPRVAELIDDGIGNSFAPAGKVFKEWVAIFEIDEKLWRSLLTEGVEFVG